MPRSASRSSVSSWLSRSLYGTGWRIRILSVVGNTASAMLLFGVGLAFFHEHISARNVAGMVLCLVGLALITQH